MKNHAYSLKITRVAEPDFPYKGQSLTCTSELLQFARDLQSIDTEKFLALYLDAQNVLLCIHVTKGTVNQAVVYPREIIRHALLSAASGMILVHNHPSGKTRPSDADIRLTQTICEIAKKLDILVHDHLVLGENDSFFSFRDHGILPN
jgi:DNA repair protein RadC